MSYIEHHDSMYRQYPDQAEEVLQIIANRYIGEHPRHPFVYRAFNSQGFVRDEEYRYIFNFKTKFSQLEDGQFVYAWAKLWANKPMTLAFNVSCLGPITVYVNGQSVFKSNLNDDVFPEQKTGFRTALNQGWNHFVLRFTSAPTGCGGWFGTGSIKGFPLHFIVPSAERSGQEGWLYSEPVTDELPVLPAEAMQECDTGASWYPDRSWTAAESESGAFARLFGAEPGRSAYAWARLSCHSLNKNVQWRGRHKGSMSIWIDNKLVYEAGLDGEFAIPLAYSIGDYNLLIHSSCSGPVWGFLNEPLPAGFALNPPVPVEGHSSPWLYLGPVSAPLEPDQICTMSKVFDGEDGLPTYWRIDEPHTWVRPYMENTLFGHWNYPLGVTLYGMIQTGFRLGRTDYVDYVVDHIELCTSFDEYALWDKEQYGAPGINHQLAAIDTLDDCGSFAAVALVAMEQRELSGGKGAVDRVAHYISHLQDRLPDGALYRARGSAKFMKDTMWCDDLYMSTPFLCRYYKLTGNEDYINDAAQQFLLYKKYMYMPEQQIMSHVYDFKFNKPTSVPWGRGNGWVLFSLTELLAVIPEEHAMRPELLRFFRDLCEGYLRLQGTQGMWHQVLTDPESYEETSCTSMFIYAFARGIRFGWLEETDPYAEAVMKGWDGMLRIAIDKQGNIYGVCKGSGYSFSPSYYKNSLSWNLNDTHGIGIVLLAGIEMIQMVKALES